MLKRRWGLKNEVPNVIAPGTSWFPAPQTSVGVNPERARHLVPKKTPDSRNLRLSRNKTPLSRNLRLSSHC